MSSEELENTVEPSRRRLLLVGGFLVLAVLAVLLLFGGAFGSSSSSTSQAEITSSLPPLGNEPVQVGDLAYDFRLQDPAGKIVTLGEHLGQPVILNFWATWCAPCRIEMPEFQAALERHSADGLVILALDQNESADIVSAYFNELGLTFTPLPDDGATVANAYGAFNLPTTIFIDRQGNVAGIHRGLLLQEQLDQQLVTILE